MVGDPVVLDPFLIGILQREGRIDLSSLVSRIQRGEFSRVVFQQRTIAPLDRYFYDLVKNGPYRRVLSDGVVSEWRSLRAPLD